MYKQNIKHSLLTADIAEKIALRLNYSCEECRKIYTAALYHDIGKEYIPQELLNKPAALTPSEYDIVKEHTRIGHDILSLYTSKMMSFASLAALYHHERYNGSGYYMKSKGEIHPSIHIIAVADVYSALIEERAYCPMWTHAKAIEYMQDNSGELFEPNVVQALRELF